MLKKKDGSDSAAESKNWYKDKYQYVVVQRNLLALLSLAALGVALAAVFAVMSLSPQKSVEPFIIEVDEKTGIVQTVNPVTRAELTANEAVSNYFLVKYLEAREGFSRYDIGQRYNLVRVLSDPQVYRNYLDEVSINNPKSYIPQLLKTNGSRDVKIKSISYLQQTQGRILAQVRFVIHERLRPNAGVTEYHRVANIAFRYADIELTREDRFINPLGFRVDTYRVDEEVLQ